ncbi:lipopolysaccharide assembly protein LapB [Halobacillus sp. Nhm2S1]|uniref:tetratricopeptide repeat protein n=1 Tax=Halobacillus sp. Nhm2S1 TaxID=2866716 RepID=UPI001C735986|nr:tetratricopeptide repeat protein [Halobacillus sp. Nhm2S1]MBX0357479.1 tetratricopeptide repeat protein [Halobacillus sp. Nhm2S1]
MTTTLKGTTAQQDTNIIPFVPTGSFYFSHGIQAFQKRRFSAAVKWLKKAIEASPDEPLYPCQLSVVYTEVGSYHAANQVLTEVLAEHGKEYVDCYYLMANNYAHLGLLNDAKKYVDTYLEQPGDGEFEEAAKQLRDMLDSLEEEDEDDDWAFEDEDELIIYQETAFYHLEHEEWEEALSVLDEMMELFPDFKIAKHRYAYALFMNGERDEAIQFEKETLEKEPANIHCDVNLATFYLKKGMTQEASFHIERLRNVFPMHEQQKLAVAETLARAGYYQEAVERFRSLRNKQVTRRRVYYKWYSISLYHTGHPSKALQLWEKGCKQFPKMGKEGGPWEQE